MKTVVIDIDGTICEELATFERPLAGLLPGARETINRWHEEGVFIILFTSRTWAEYRMTAEWLEDYGINYDVLLCGKPVADLWIDDRALRFVSWEQVNEAVKRGSVMGLLRDLVMPSVSLGLRAALKHAKDTNGFDTEQFIREAMKERTLAPLLEAAEVTEDDLRELVEEVMGEES